MTTYNIVDSNGTLFLTHLNAALNELAGGSHTFNITDSSGSVLRANVNAALALISGGNSYALPDSDGHTFRLALNNALNAIAAAQTPFNPTNFIESVQGLAITPVGSPVLSTAQKKFGTSSLY